MHVAKSIRADEFCNIIDHKHGQYANEKTGLAAGLFLSFCEITEAS